MNILNRMKYKYLYPNCFISDEAYISNCELGYKSNITRGVTISNSTIGKRTSVGRGTTVVNANVGSYCAISWGCSLGGGNHPYKRISGSAAFFQKRFELVDKTTQRIDIVEEETLSIGHDVWIGSNAIVLSGLSIGTGAIIGAGAVVTHDVEPYSIVAGSPARVIGRRFSKDISDKLLEMKWWDFKDDVIRANITLFQKDVDETVINHLMELRKNI